MQNEINLRKTPYRGIYEEIATEESARRNKTVSAVAIKQAVSRGNARLIAIVLKKAEERKALVENFAERTGKKIQGTEVE
jgi:hypothetical protein